MKLVDYPHQELMFHHGDEVEIQGIGAGTLARPGLSRSRMLHPSAPHQLFVWQ